MATDYSSIFANAAKGYSGGSSGATNRPSGNFMGSGKSYEDYSYDRSLQQSRDPGSMTYGQIPRAAGQDWNEWMGQQSAFNNTYTGPGIATARAAATQRDNPSGVSARSVPRSGGGGGGGGGGVMMLQPPPIEFYLGPAPTLEELNLNYEEMGKRAMEANAPFAAQYKQFAPQTEAGTRALSQAGATMATGQLSRDMVGEIGRGAAALGFSSGLGGRSGIGRNILARDLGLGSLQVQQQGADLLSKSSMLAQQAMQAALANQQAGISTQQATEQSKQYGYGQEMTAAQQRAQYGLAAQQAQEQSNQFGYGQQMNAAQQRAQYGLAGQQAGEQSKQFGANLGMQGIQQQLAAAGTLGQLGQTQFGQQKDIINAQSNAGAQRQAQQQQKLTQDYNDFQAQKQHPYQQLSYMSDMLRGLPMSQSTQAMYQAPPSAISQLGGAAIAGKYAGLYKKGGIVKASKKSAGLAALALKRMG